MSELKKIKLKKLRDYLKVYHHFTPLSEQEKIEYINRIEAMSEEDQEKVFLWLLHEEEKEKSRVLSKFKTEIDLMTNQMQMIINEKIEGQEALKDQLEEIELQKKFNQ